jgi:soluble lytic murein transglycosylase-like protein
VPESAYDERLHEWRVREAMSRGDWPAALTAIRKMASKQRSDPRWRYFEGRMLEKTGQAQQAQPLFRDAARAPTFHGFLAADKLQQGYPVPVEAERQRAGTGGDRARPGHPARDGAVPDRPHRLGRGRMEQRAVALR